MRRLVRNILVMVAVFVTIYAYYAFFLGSAPWVEFWNYAGRSGKITYIRTSRPSVVGVLGGVLPIWKRPLPRRFGADSLVLDSGLLVVESSRNELVAFNRGGETVWQFIPANSHTTNLDALPSTGESAVIVEPCYNGTVGVTASGVLAWYKAGLQPIPVGRSLTTPTRGRIFLGYSGEIEESSLVVCLDEGGNEQWRYEPKGDTIEALGQGTNGEVFLVSSKHSIHWCGVPDDGWLYAISFQGKLLWNYRGTPASVWPPPLTVGQTAVRYSVVTEAAQIDLVFDYEGDVISQTRHQYE